MLLVEYHMLLVEYHMVLQYEHYLGAKSLSLARLYQIKQARRTTYLDQTLLRSSCMTIVGAHFKS